MKAELLARHCQAVEAFLLAAEQVPNAAWLEPLAPGKWSPAEVVAHILESYRLYTGELRGGPGMKLKLKPTTRWMLKHTVMRRALRSGQFPPNARAPAEVRPKDVERDQQRAIAGVRGAADEFVAELTQRAAAGPVRLSHAYFGILGAVDGLKLTAVHTAHHARQLARSGSDGSHG